MWCRVELEIADVSEGGDTSIYRVLEKIRERRKAVLVP
jgi:hypothetical protein